LTGSILTHHKEAYAIANGLEIGQMTKANIREALYGGYQTNMIMFAGIYMLAAIFWMFIRAETPLPGSGLAGDTTLHQGTNLS
jgi:hypothetical protein